MDSFPPEYPFGFGFGERPSPTRRELQGPRPTPLRVNKDSHKIKKPPVAPHPPAAALLRTAPPPPAAQNPQPVIIYAVSPKVIHTTVSDFMNVVQRLTGPSFESSAAAGGSGALSPAARLASIEKTSPSERERERQTTEMAAFDATDVVEIVGNSTVEMGQIPGILSPAPTSLLPISPPGLFSPASDPLMFINNMWSMSPSSLFSAPLISPSPSSLDIFNPFFDF
ncbi:PREDICTED: protein MKS1-like [Ipomoea nil]|uniref:protein MKS1-like n=1 Tax=Ipomoea nil TaxID=35883 RepID=UPI00090178CF|nr:PREDICTED: protein MKS1-like [Ipomoea nil]